MKRPLIVAAVSLVFGIATAKAFDSVFLAALSSVLAACIAAIFFHKSVKMLCIIVTAILFYTAGSLEYLYVKNASIKRFEGFYGENVILRGIIDSPQDINGVKTSYRVRTIEITCGDRIKKIRGKVLFTALNDGSTGKFDYGREVIIRGRLNMPTGKRNPGGFNYRDYLARSGVSATIFSRGENVVAGEMSNRNFFIKAGINLRDKIIRIIEKSLPQRHAALLEAMLVGYKGGLSKEVKEAFSDAGISHIIAVSGAHVGFIMFPFAYILKKIRLNRRIANIVIIFVLILFVFITGFQASVLRAVIMAVIVLAGKIARREADVFTSIAFAAILLLLYNPYNLFDIGFQLSFTATISLVLFYKKIREYMRLLHIPDPLAEILSITLAAQTGVLPLTVLYFNKLSTLSLITNLLVVPLLQTITILGMIMVIAGTVSLFLSQIVGYINCSLLSFILFVAKINSKLPFSVIRIITPPILFIILYYAVVFMLLLYKPILKKMKAAHYAAFLAVLTISIVIYTIPPGKLEVVFIDVGQGDSAFIRTSSGKTVLIDGGGSNGDIKTRSNIGDTVVIPFLLDYGAMRINVVIATHGHSDHIEGLGPVLNGFDVGSLVIPKYEDKSEFKDILDAAEKRKIPVARLNNGCSIKLDDGTYMEVLSPGKDNLWQGESLNNTSLVLKLYYRNTTFLFTGDIEKEIEKGLVDRGVELKADVLKVPHHGSDTSSTEEFIKNVYPKAAVISVGRNNFGHPSPTVLKRYKDFGVPVFRTDQCGAIIVRSDGKRIKIRKTI